MVCFLFLLNSPALLGEACKEHKINLTLEMFETKDELSLKLQMQYKIDMLP